VGNNKNSLGFKSIRTSLHEMELSISISAAYKSVLCRGWG